MLTQAVLSDKTLNWREWQQSIREVDVLGLWVLGKAKQITNFDPRIVQLEDTEKLIVETEFCNCIDMR